MYWILISIIVILLSYALVDRILRDEEFEKIPGPKGIFLLGNALDFMRDSGTKQRRVFCIEMVYVPEGEICSLIERRSLSKLVQIKVSGRIEALIKYLETLTLQFRDVFKIKMGPKKIVFLMHPEDVELLISGTKFNSKGYMYGFLRPWLNDGLLLSDGAKWHERRKVLTPAFHFNILRHFHSVLIDKMDNLVKQIRPELGKPRTDVYHIVTDLSLSAICETAMGTALDEDATETSRKYKSAIHKLGTYILYRFQRIWLYPNIMFNISTSGRDQKKLLKLLSSFRDEVIKKRRETIDYSTLRKKQNEDNEDVFVNKKKRLAMLDLLLEAEKEGTINLEGINEEVDTFMFEGYDTTATALQFAFLMLANHQDVQENIIEESSHIYTTSEYKPTMNDLASMKYLDAFIKESLRLYPPVHFINRKSDLPLQFKNFRCPAGTEYAVVIYELHRRKDQFEEPLQFKPERFLKDPTWHQFSYLPFSAGPRNCIGQKFAMLEMKLTICSVLREYRLLPITKREDIVLYMDMILRTKDPIYVKFEKRSIK